jgi:predicted MFS family arabinose efflux permease
VPPVSFNERDIGVRSRFYAWVVFALTFGLLISDYMARQVLNAVFPLLKAEWLLSDAQLGALSGVVALMVGVLTFPLSLLADRWGRIRSLVVMAALWSVATLACGLAQSYGQMLVGRMFVGVGEAAYGSVGIAVVLTVFPTRMRATMASAFMAGGLFGQVLGVGIGGQVAAAFGWRWAFAAIALAGLVLTLVYPLVVRERWVKSLRVSLREHDPETEGDALPSLRSLFANRAVLCAYVGSGLQLYVAGTIPAWLPTYFTRYYGLGIGHAGSLAALFLLTGGVGMVLCGMLSDRLARHRPERKIDLAIFYCFTCALLIFAAFRFQPGMMQLALLGAATFVAAGTTGPAGAMVANLTPRAIHGTAFATLTLANNLLGLAPGPVLTGRLADALGLLGALQLLPIACLLSIAAFLIARTTYRADLSRMTAPIAKETPA